MHAPVMGLTATGPIETAAALTRALVLRAQRGDAQAFGELLESHYDLIHRTAWKWCGNRADAEDIAQDVCVKLGSVLAGFDHRSAFSSWLYRITLNAVRDLQRAGARRGRQALAFADTVHVTHVEAEIDGDTFFPALDPTVFAADAPVPVPAGEKDSFPTRFVSYHRRAVKS